MNRIFIHNDCICPYYNPDTCNDVKRKSIDNRQSFICIKCEKKMCTTYAYKSESSICWSCGLKTSSSVMIHVNENYDMT